MVIKTVFVEYSTGWRYGVLHVAYKWNFMEYLRNSYFLIELHDRCKIGHMEYSMATIWCTPYGTYIGNHMEYLTLFHMGEADSARNPRKLLYLQDLVLGRSNWHVNSPFVV